MAINPKTAVYFVPGLAAGKEIFEYISLPNHLYDIHILEWITPHTNESIKHYAKRMTDLIVEPNVILIGVSFGGVVAQEMSCFLKLKKLIIISSVKSANEIPFKLKILKRIPVYRLIPRRFLESTKTIVRYGLGVKSTNKIKFNIKNIFLLMTLNILSGPLSKWLDGKERTKEITLFIYMEIKIRYFQFEE